MRAYLINPTAKTVEEQSNDQSWPLEAIKEAISTGSISGAALFPDQRLGDRVWVDDEGFLQAGGAVFFIGEYALPLAGNGLVLGLTHAGENADPRTPLDQLQAAVQFTNMVTTGRLTPMVTTPTGIHMGLPICATAPGWAPAKPARASFAFELWGPIVRLEDVGNHAAVPTVTNDAEAVFANLKEAIGPRMMHTPVLYADSDGSWDAMLPTETGDFGDFLPLGAASYEAATRRLEQIFGDPA